MRLIFRQDNIELLLISSQSAKVARSQPDVSILAQRAEMTSVQVDLLVALQALPLQGLCLLVLPLPWAFPRLLNLQFASPLALFEGLHRILNASAKTLRASLEEIVRLA